MSVFRGAFVVAACALFATLGAPSSSQAQPAQCAGEAAPTAFGQLCLVNAPLPALTQYDYGAVRVNFRPPPSLNDVIPTAELRGTWLQALARRTVAQRVRSVVMFLELRASGPGIPSTIDENGREIGVAIGMLPLAVYRYSSEGRLQFDQAQHFIDRTIGPRLLVNDNMLVHARVRTVFSQQDPSQVIAAVAPLVQTVTALGVEGALLDALATRELIASATAVEGWLRSANNLEGAADDFVDMRFGGVTQLDFSFQLNPRTRRGQAPPPRGMLRVALERRPSLFTSDLLPGEPGRQLPDYGTRGQLDSVATGRIMQFGTSALIGRDPEVRRQVDAMQDVDVTRAAFDEMCQTLRTRLQNSGLSLHDATAVAWAVFVTGESAARSEIQSINCVSRDLALWRTYNFAVPATQPPPPALPSEAALQRWLTRDVRIALLDRRAADGLASVRALFADRVQIAIAPGTLYAVGDEPTDSYLSGDGAARVVRGLRVGCRFVRPGANTPNLPRFSVLARREDNDALLTLTIDYAGRADGGIEIVGLAAEPTPESDFAILSAATGTDARCLVRETTPPSR